MASVEQKIQQNGLNMNGGQPLAGMLIEQAAAFAAAGANQAGATAITSQTALVNAGTGGVSLPLATPGLEIAIINDTTSALVVYAAPAGSDTINDQNGAGGVIQMAKSMVIYSAPLAGAWFAEGLATGFAPSGVNIETTTAAAGLSATGTGSASATALNNAINQITTNAGSPAGATLPAAKAGLTCMVANATTTALVIYGAGSDTISVSAAAAASYSLAANKTVSLFCVANGVWHGAVSA
jgi:hypothetical protein